MKTYLGQVSSKTQEINATWCVCSPSSFHHAQWLSVSTLLLKSCNWLKHSSTFCQSMNILTSWLFCHATSILSLLWLLPRFQFLPQSLVVFVHEKLWSFETSIFESWSHWISSCFQCYYHHQSNTYTICCSTKLSKQLVCVFLSIIQDQEALSINPLL